MGESSTQSLPAFMHGVLDPWNVFPADSACLAAVKDEFVAVTDPSYLAKGLDIPKLGAQSVF